MHYRKLWLASAGIGALMAAPGAQAQSAESGADPAYHGAEIVVTASKREERLRDVPTAITAIGSDAIETLGIRDFRDYATLTPGLSQRDFGAPGTGTVILRGLNTGPQQTTNTSAFYIDDAPYSSNGFLSVGSLVTPSPDLVDVERIEVLKGPQGTLYGASNLGGLVRIITKKADTSTFAGMAQVEGETLAHGDEGWAARAAVNLPVVTDKLAIRVSGFYRKTAGFTDNVATGENNVNSSTIKGGRIALRATPTERLTIDVAGFYQDIENDGSSGQDNVTGTTRPLFGKYKFSAVQGTGGSTIKYRSVGGTASYETDAGAVVAVANYVKTQSAISSDYTDIYGSYLSLIGIVPPGTQTIGALGPNMKKFSAELRFVSERIGAFEFVAGGFYTNEKSRYPFTITARNAAGTPLPTPFDILFRSTSFSNYEEYAAFGNLTFYLTDRLDVTGGIRYAKNDQNSSGPGGILFYAPTPPTSTSFSDDATTYLATIRYRPTDNVSLYARAASGYRPGGPQTSTLLPPTAQKVIRADTVWNYEAGIKATALDGALSANLAVYHIDWKDIQLNTLFGGVTLQGNAGSAKVDGFELELQARPSRNFVFGANVGHTHARISKIDPVAAASLGAKSGDELPLTPSWTVAAFADQKIPFSDTVKGSVGATIRLQSDMPSSYPGYALNPNIKIPSITTVDLRAGLEMSPVSFQLRVENLFDKLGYTSLATNALYAGQPVPTNATVTRPRAFILSATANF